MSKQSTEKPIVKNYNTLDERKLLEAKTIDRIERSINGLDTKGKPKAQRLLPKQRDVLWAYYLALEAGERKKLTSKQSILAEILPVKNFGLYCKKPFKQVKKADIQNWVTYLRKRSRDKGKCMSESTLCYYRFIIKIFFRWLYQTGKKYPKVVDWIEDKTSEKRFIDETTILSNEEIKLLIQACDHDRDKAMIIMAYEGGLRVSELTFIKIRDIKFGEGYCEITVDGKTKKRTIPFVDSVPYCQNWLNNHPFKSNKDSPLFINISKRMYGRQIRQMAFRGVLLRAAIRAKIGKKVFPHLLRHSRLTHLAQQGFNEKDLKLYAGWKDTSCMPDVYLHYGYEGLKTKILTQKKRLSNAERAQQIREQNANNPKDCPRCGKENPSDALYCNCGMALDLRTVEQELRKRDVGDVILNKIVNDPELSKVFAELVKKAQVK